MASFHTKTFQLHDDYMTPKHAWEDIAEYIPKDKIIWEAFYGDGASGNHLSDLGWQEEIHRDGAFYEEGVGGGGGAAPRPGAPAPQGFSCQISDVKR